VSHWFAIHDYPFYLLEMLKEAARIVQIILKD